VSKARAPVGSTAKTSAAKPPTAPKTPAKKSAGKARG
jgi:DNA topoisomerase I